MIATWIGRWRTSLSVSGSNSLWRRIAGRCYITVVLANVNDEYTKQRKIMKKLILYIPFLAIILICACGSAGYLAQSVPLGFIATEGVEIRAEDGSFVLKSGEQWKPPFENISSHEMHRSNADMINFHREALDNMGARKVRVKVPYQSEELYGVLLLSKIYSGCTGAETRSYRITIPESYYRQAQNGKISVLYEYYSQCGELIGTDLRAKTWVLWMSDVPFR